ncbi:MAG: FAD-dependent monooxygenase [Halobacteriovoraceae bacterium]|nr:FAD-dependent monooxygenase [Halobacteriovoraceae bacterium]MCB9095521.1 FAD-dependent monooxygenase [Halobacteriovoraceae bacterium]
MILRSNHVAIIGGGPIGLFMALSLSKQGYTVDIFEKKNWPVDKVCGQGIMPSGVEILRSVGVNLNNVQDSYPFKGVEYIDGEIKVMGKLQVCGVGVERRVLSQKLYDLAYQNENIHLYPFSRLTKIVNLDGKVEVEINQTEKKSYRYLFACDGMNSGIRKVLGNEVMRNQKSLRMGARLHFDITPWSQCVQTYWSEGVEAYVTPVSSHRVEVAFLWFCNEVEKGGELYKRLMEKFPELEKRLNNLVPSRDFKAYGPFKNYSKSLRQGNIFFVGDAYRFLDGITGEGISIGLKAAQLVSNNFEKFHLNIRIQLFFLYLHYAFFVSFALFFSRRKNTRHLLLKFLKIFPVLFDFILHLNDRPRLASSRMDLK